MSDAAHTRGKKKATRKPEHEPDPEFQIAPMIDILLVLLVFFMSISSTEVLQSNINVTYTSINDLTAIEVDQQNYAMPADIVPILINKVSANPLLRVLIRADREVRYDYVRKILEAVGQSGVGNVTFSVVDKDGQAPAAT